MQNYAVSAVSAAVFVSAPSTFARVCGQVGTFHGAFKHMTRWDAPPGFCLTLRGNGSWYIGGFSASGVPNVTLGSGVVVAAAVKSVWTTISIAFEDDSVSAFVGTVQVATVLPLQAEMHGDGRRGHWQQPGRG